MQLVTSRTISPNVNINLLQSDFSKMTRSLEKQNRSARLYPFIDFQGQISVGEFLFPVQKFSLTEKGDLVFIENFPTNSFPKIEIVLEQENLNYKVKDFKVRPSDNSVEGEISYTGFFLIINEVKKCSLHINKADIPPFKFSFAELSSEVKKQVLFSAKLFRKLRFIEEYFNVKFNLPETISWREIAQIEVLFRGLTEGEFSSPIGNSITIFNYKLTKDDLKNLSVPERKSFSFEFNEDLLVLGRFFSVGKILFETNKASIANPLVLRDQVEGNILQNVRLNIFDHQVIHRFEKYLKKEKLLKNKRKLEQFKNTLRKKEPEFLVALLDEPLAEINEKSAREIVEGLLQYNDFPDRFSVLQPELEENYWKVPIALTYPKYQPIFLTDAFVEVGTGKAEMEISFDELLEKGKRKAEEVFSIA